MVCENFNYILPTPSLPLPSSGNLTHIQFTWQHRGTTRGVQQKGEGTIEMNYFFFAHTLAAYNSIKRRTVFSGSRCVTRFVPVCHSLGHCALFNYLTNRNIHCDECTRSRTPMAFVRTGNIVTFTCVRCVQNRKSRENRWRIHFS